MTTNVYIDGFNFYYCAVKGTRYKWLDLFALSRRLFPAKTIHRVKYFSAIVQAFPHDPDSPNRQAVYWRALKTLPQVEIIPGNFSVWPRWMPRYPLVYPDPSKPPDMVHVLKAEEKGSDVNLAAYLIYDNCREDADESVVISNDADLVKAIEIVTSELRRPVIVVNPNRTKMVHKYPHHCAMHRELQRVSTQQIFSINKKVLVDSQFPSAMSDPGGTFTKPSKW